MLLVEIFNTKKTENNFVPMYKHDRCTISFEVEGTPYRFSAISYKSTEGTWVVNFHVDVRRYEQLKNVKIASSDKHDFAIKRNNLGNAVKVFLAVEECFDMFLQHYGAQVQHVEFSADTNEQSRIKLYNKFIPLIQNKGFKFLGSDEFLGDIHYSFSRS